MPQHEMIPQKEVEPVNFGLEPQFQCVYPHPDVRL